jgi:hypothetical protein
VAMPLVFTTCFKYSEAINPNDSTVLKEEILFSVFEREKLASLS